MTLLTLLTPGQLLFLVIITELIVFVLLNEILATIRHCATAKIVEKAIENGLISPIDAKKILENGNNMNKK